ncbi:unnamed protein product [Gongylonema pulchrum]|uniref:Immunoglobulin I-set domain protein n=1 Tax=Gongylonema pulchrum TaxID=637853 RepID=A0A183CU89_9BILA|nr:unnamed protein product [Gongylonema pulchrum]
MLQSLDRNGGVRLNIMNVRASDSGEYSCEAANALGKDLTQCNLKIIDTTTIAEESVLEELRVSVVEADLKAPVITRPLRDAIVNAGSHELLEMEVDAYPRPSIEWFFNGKLLEESLTVQTDFDGHLAVLKISEAHTEHQGQYLCRVSNKAGTAETRCSIVVEEEIVKEERAPKMPKFVEKLQDVTVENEGDTLTLKCKVVSEPEAEVVWLLNGKAIRHDDDNARSRVFDDGICVLEILRVTAETCGTYTAVAHNILGDAHTSAEVSLGATVPTKPAVAPFFVIAPKEQMEVEEGSVLSLVCDIDGEPEPRVRWLKDQRVIEDARVAIHKDGISHQLIISPVLLNDKAIYTVEAENESGKIDGTIEVLIVPRKEPEPAKEDLGILPPEAPVGEPFAAKLYKNGLLLRWDAPEEDGGATIDSYIVEQRRPDDRTWTQVGQSPKTEIKVDGLQPNTEYLFRVAAKNKAGQGAYSPVSSAIKTLAAGKKPVFTKVPPAAVLISGSESVELVAEFDGEPAPSVKWYHNGREIVGTRNDVEITTARGKWSKLVIRVLELDVHAGRYSCHIENEYGEAVCETWLTKQKIGSAAEDLLAAVETEVMEGAPQIVTELSNETVTAGQQFILTCKALSTPKGVISWFKNDERLASVGRYEMQEQDGVFKLICHRAQNSDNATYRCVLTNSIGIAQSACQVTVVERMPLMAPKFETLLTDKTVLSGKEIKLKCRVTGDPEPQILWMKDGIRISTSSHQKLEFTEDGWCSLTIFNCTANDTGVYLCTAQNLLGVESSQSMITVADTAGPDSHLITAEDKQVQYSKPRFTRTPGALIETTEGSTVKLVSRAIGQPTPLVKWLKDGKEVTKVNRAYEIRLTGEGESVLVIACAVAKTAGTFKCVAENCEGSESVETRLVVHSHLHKQPGKEPPSFTTELTDMGVALGHPVTLKCCVHGVPEPQLKWIFINDAQQTTVLRSAADSAWIECRRGETCEMKTESVVSTQQGTYQCVAFNEHGTAMTQCYLLVGEPTDQPAGPPRFLKCIRDVWSPLGENIEFEVEVSGYPLPELTWYHMDERVIEDKNVQITYVTPTKCQLKITSIGLRHLGSYSVEAANVHGIVRTTASLNVGRKRGEAEPPKFHEANCLQAAGQRQKPSRLDVKRKGAAPAFLIGLEDLELREGDAAALAGTVAKKRRHRILGRARDEKRMVQIVEPPELDAETSSSSVEPQIEITTLEEIRASIAERNKNICRPKFMVKPKSKKSITEYKSLRLKTAISANPTPVVRWDKAGVVLETGNKYSIYNDGDFYYLEVHHMSKIDEGFYNCTASNSEGFVTSTAEIEVIGTEGSIRRQRKEPAAPSFIEVLPGKLKATNGDPVTVECSVSGYPAPAIQWLRNGAELTPQHDRYTISYDGETTTLKFVSIATSDTGKYVCVASNQHGEAKTAMQLDVEPRRLPPTGGTPPKFHIDKRREVIRASDGDRVVLTADLLEGSEPLTVRWIRNRMEVQDSSGFAYLREEANCSLIIADAFPEDAGVYTCEASNEFGSAKCNIRLIITERRKKSVYESPPAIINAPTNVSVEPGNDLSVSLTVRGYPEPAVVWTKNAAAISSDEKHQVLSNMSNSGEVFTLTVLNCTGEDAGKYELQAINSSGTATALITVQVTEVTNLDVVLPRFTKLPISVQSAIGQKTTLSCNFKGLQPTVTWFHGDEKLTSGRHGIEIVSTSTSSTLSILQLTEEHLGEYLCTIRNEYGEDLAKAVILLEGANLCFVFCPYVQIKPTLLAVGFVGLKMSLLRDN